MTLATRFAIIDALMIALDEEHAEAVVEHRRITIKKPLALRAAQLLAKEFAKCPDPNAAADEMIMNAWQGFRADWVKQSAKPHLRIVHSAEKPRRTGDMLFDLCQRREADG